jgi:hypothetical protein
MSLAGTRFFHSVDEMDGGELIPIYGATFVDSYGSLLCEYMALATVKKLIVECEQVFDDFAAQIDNKPELADQPRRVISEHLSRGRDDAIRGMAKSATLHLIAFFQSRLFDTVVEAVEDCKLMANAQIAVALATQLNEIAPGAISVDARAKIDEAADRVAEKKRTMLRDHIAGLPHLLTKRSRGAPLKPPHRRKLEREAYATRVEAAYRKVRERDGRKPTKVSVAAELGVGGIDPRRGSDTRLNAFANKLRRLGIDYEAIADKVESELHE